MIVVDASIVATALADDGDDGDTARSRLRGESLSAPGLLDLEVLSVWRRAARAGRLERRRARQALTDLAELPLARAPHVPLLERIWELGDNLSPNDAAYIALAETLDVAFLTADRRLARAPGIACNVEVLG